MKNPDVNKQKPAIVIVFFLIISTHGISQRYALIPQRSLGVSFVSQMCANGYGTQYLPFVSYNNGRKCISIAPAIQKRKCHLSGVQVNGEYALTGKKVKDSEDCRVELFVFMSLAYHQGALMSKNTERIEQKMNDVFTENHMEKFRFSSVETYAGFGLKVPVLKKFIWTSSIGAGCFYSIHHPAHMYHYTASKIGLLVNTGISIELCKIHSLKSLL